MAACLRHDASSVEVGLSPSQSLGVDGSRFRVCLGYGRDTAGFDAHCRFGDLYDLRVPCARLATLSLAALCAEEIPGVGFL